MFLLNFIIICGILHEKGYSRQILICTTLFWEHIHCFTNLKFVRENLIFHFFPSVDRFSNNILILNDRTLRKICLKVRGFWGGSDEKIRKMWFRLGIVVVGLPPLVWQLQKRSGILIKCQNEDDILSDFYWLWVCWCIYETFWTLMLFSSLIIFVW